ncbi:DegV family protein with EDD domain [Entomoplasma freundtii]|uniref:Fatty acid-binding protein DegV n=1 Tax=Entomoplasma freundtii TaxID=74700 RepID=A0A2K8NRI0_9MOLU|nr:DegV family protein [Entomoplasma freundtii]ATZ16440.1 fatty acid-binding protein DegV [Entomoplasma freundtii]TDY55970.1 DegV family protein with EDD domain [Entomoplasma freundtii]
MKIGILVDSSATADPTIFTKTLVECLPLHLTYGAEVDILDTPENMEKHQVYESIKQGAVWKTSQASPGEVAQRYEKMLKKYDHVIHIPITDNLSSMLGTALIVSRENRFVDKVTVIKNNTLAAQAISLMALHLSTLIKEGVLETPEMVVDEFYKMATVFYIGIIPGDLKRLASGGRATKIASSILNVFKTKVLIRWQEKPEKEGMGRTVGSLTDKAVRGMKELFPNQKFHVILTTVPIYNEKNRKAAAAVLKEEKIKYSKEPIPHLYPVHAGLETVGFIAYPLNFKIHPEMEK